MPVSIFIGSSEDNSTTAGIILSPIAVVCPLRLRKLVVLLTQRHRIAQSADMATARHLGENYRQCRERGVTNRLRHAEVPCHRY